MSEYKELIVLSTAQQGLESLAQSSIRSFCLARDFMLPRVSVISFVLASEPESVPYLGVYKASTGELVTYSNEILPCSGMSDGGYRISYKTRSVIETANEPGFIFAFYDDIPVDRYHSSPGTVDVAARNGALLEYTLDTVWAISDSVETTQMPYVELSAGVMYTDEDEIDCTYAYTPFDEVGEVIVSVLGNAKYYGSFINTDAGVITYKSNDSEDIHSSNTSAVAVRSSMTATSAADQLEVGKLQNLYIEDGWMPLLTFKMPDNWEWDICAIKPNDRNEYNLCGRISNGTLEWQFGNLVSAATTPATIEAYEKLVFNKETGEWEVVVIDPDAGGSGGGGSSPSTPAETLKGFIETVAHKNGSFNPPILGWAGEEESKKTMLKDGKLRASCEPVYLGMFNLSMSYLAGIVYDVVDDPKCDKTCDFSSNQSYYEAVQEVSPVWFLFASTKNDLLNLVAIEHKIYAGEMDGTWLVPEDITNPYDLYGPPPIVLDKYCEGKPPVSYENFRIWLYTNFILPPSRDMVHVPEDTDELQAGYYYVHNITGSYYRIPDDLIESGCKSTPSPRWMLAHSVIDTDENNAVEVPLCTMGEDNSVSVFNNTNKGYRGFIDNVLDHEYRWQRLNNSWEYVPYTASSYVADINKTEGLAFQTQAYLPVGSRYSKTYASYTNYVFRLISVGRCLKFETVNASDSVGDSIVGDGVYVISVPGGIEYTSSVFKRVEEAPVEVKSIAVTTGTTLAYDTPPERNITDISVFEGDIGDGNIAITNKATVTYDDPGNIVLYNEYNSPYYGISWVAPGFVLGGRNAYRRSEDGIWSYASMSESDPKASTYTGTLVLQGRNMPEIDLTSFSNVILDQAILYPIDHTVFGNVTVPNDTLGGISFPESLRFVLPVRMSSSTSPIYVDRSISVTNASGNEEVFGEVINGSTVYAFYQYASLGSSTFNNIVFGQGDGGSVSTEAGLLPDTAGETTGLKAYFKLTSRPRLKNQYAGIVYDIPPNVRKFRLSFEVSYPETTVYPIKYSVWLPYNSDPDAMSATPIQAECLLDVTQLSDEYLYVDTEIEVPEDSAINYNNKVLVLFVTDSNTDSAGKPVLVKEVLMQAICNTNDGVDAHIPLTGSLRGYTHIKNLHIDEDGKFACYSGVDGSTVDIEVLEGSGVLGIGAVPEGYFKNAAGTNTLRIRNAENFDGIYYLGDDFSQYSRADDISDKITPSEYSSIAVQGNNICLMDGFRSNIELTRPSTYTGYIGDVLKVDRLILCNNSTLCTSNSAVCALGANECIVGQGVNITVPFLTLGHGVVGENPIGISSYGAFSFSSKFEALAANIRGTVTRLTSDTVACVFTVNLSYGLDQFERVAAGTKVYTTQVSEGSNLDFIEDVSGDTITVTDDGAAYYYAIKGNAVQGTGGWLDRVVLKSETIVTAVLPGGAPVTFYRTSDGSVVFKTPAGYDPLTSTSSDSVPISDSDVFILEGNMDFAVDDRYMDLTTWVDVDRLSRYYIKDVNDPNNTCYELERTTLTCCDPTPVDCCDEPIIYGGSCNKNCGTPPQPCPDGGTNIPGCGDDNGGGNGNNKDEEEDDEDDPGGGGGGGGGTSGRKPSDWSPPEHAGKHMYTAQGQVYLYTVDGALKGTYTNVDAKIVGTRGGSASSNRVTFSVPAHKLKLSFEDVANNVVGNGARIAELAGEMTFPVTFTMDSGPQDYSYPKGKACVPGKMYYGMTSLSSAAVDHLRLGIIYNSSDNGGQRGETTYTKNIKMAIEDIGVVVKISDTFEVGPTQAPKSIERKLTAMGLKWEQVSSKPKKIYNGADYCVIRINSIVISPVANFRSRVISNSIPSADFQCRGKTRGSIELGSTGMPSMGPTITAKSSTSRGVRVWRKDGTGLGKQLSLNTKMIVTNYTMAGDTLTTISGDLQNSEWNYCAPGQTLPENATEYPSSRASGKIFGHNYIIVEGELMNR